ncbi:hypothetical protein RUM44_004385 [Polyplax serrata]|uniref:Peptidase M14 domain-containing protein n=1 Tax=Polyplax serrata TaxID=468196 RepID=A0ABR1B315_POLSC
MGFNWQILLVSLIAGVQCYTETSNFVFKHHSNEELANVLKEVHSQCPNVTRLYTLSEPSVLGEPLYVIEFAESPGRHQLLQPEFKYIANMHGNEVLGRELLLKLADSLCEEWRLNNPDVRKLIKYTRIHLMPTMNPDGYALASKTYNNGVADYLIGRTNNNSVDLNRNFPDLDRIMFGYEQHHINHNNHLLEQLDHLDEPIQPETRAVMRLIMQVPFVLSANLHGGDLVANYPYDASRSGAVKEYSKSPDDETFRHLALSYSLKHKEMSDPKRKGCGYDGYNFGKQGGITNGAAWYSVKGGMQDFNYLSSNDFEITLELGCEKYPSESTLESEWEKNKDALMNFMWQSHIGIKGLVADAFTGKRLANAVIHVKNITHGRNVDIQHDVTSVHGGDYWRLLTPGEYLVTAQHDDYIPLSKRVVVTNKGHEQADRVDFYLQPIPASDINLLPDNNLNYDTDYEDTRNVRKRWFYGINLFNRNNL